MKLQPYIILIITYLFFNSLYAQENPDIPTWNIVGDETFPEIDQNWYRANGICGIGQVKSIFVDPKDKNHVIIGSYGGGIWETTNALESNNKNVKWRSLTNTIFANTVEKVLVMDDYIYASTSSKIASNLASSKYQEYGLGVIKKHKDSTHWEISDFKFSCNSFDIVQDNGNKTIYAISRRKVYKSIDNGITWTNLNDINNIIKGEKTYFHRVIINPLDPKTVFVFPTNSSVTLIKTIDGGKTWKDMSYIFDDLIEYQIQAKKSTTMPFYDIKENKLYIALHINNYAFIISSDDWENFEIYNKSTTKGLRVSAMKNTSFFKINDTDFFFGATQLHHLKDGASSVNLSRNKIHDDIRDIKYFHDEKTNESIYYFGHDGGIAVSKNYGGNFINISGNLNLFQIYNMAYNNFNGHRIITIGVQDGSWYRIDRDGSNKWDAIEMCCEGGVHTQPDDPNVVYFVNNGRLTRADNGVDYPISKKKSITRIEGPDTPIAIHPNNPNSIIYADFSWPNSTLKISYDKGDSDMTLAVEENGKMKGRPTAMAFDKSNPSKFYMASLYYTPKTNPNWKLKNHLYRTENIDDSSDSIVFTDIIDNLRNLDQDVLDKAAITDIEVNNDKIWVCFGNLDNGKKIYYSNNAGNDWENISFNLPNTPANVIEYIPSIDRLFLGTDIGIYIFNSKQWDLYGTGLPKAVVTDIETDIISKEIIASVYGRSVWVTDFPKQTSSIKYGDFLISENTNWTKDHKFYGKLIIGKKVTLQVNDATIAASNIILEKGASLIWNGGRLSPNTLHSINKADKANMILKKKSSVKLDNVTIDNYNIYVTKRASIKYSGLTKINSRINLLKKNRL